MSDNGAQICRVLMEFYMKIHSFSFHLQQELKGKDYFWKLCLAYVLT